MQSMKSRIILVILSIVCLLCLILGVSGCYLNYNTAISVLDQSMRETAQTAADQVAAEILAIQNVAVETGCIKELSDPLVPLAEKQAMIEQRAALHGFQRGNLLAISGISYFDGNDYSERDYFQAAAKGKTYISSPTVSKITGKLTFLISAPLWKDGVPNSSVVGVVYYAPNESFLNDIVTGIQISQTGYAYMINKSGTNVADKTPSLVGAENSIADAANDPSLAALAKIEQDMIAGGEGFGFYSYEGARWAQGYAPVGNTDGWSLGVAAQATDFLGNFYASLLTTLILAVVFILIGVFTATAFANSISRPVRACSERLKQLSAGDLHTPVEVVNRRDEVGALSSATKELVDGLSGIIRDLTQMLGKVEKGDLTASSSLAYTGDFVPIQTAMQGIVSSLNAAMKRIRQASNHVSNSAEQVSSGSQALAQGATEQASSVEELSATISEVADQVSKNAENAVGANKLSTGAGVRLMAGNEQMEQLLAAMEEISGYSRKIAVVMATIDNIAFQTNILALNAAVEAARAGSAGKGFAVVADEVRALANKSAEAAEGTQGLIEGSARAVERGTQLARETAQTMMDVMYAAKSATDMVGEIATASHRQAEDLAQISDGVEQVSSVVQTNSATAQESAATSEELSGQASILHDLVRRFQTE